MKKTVILILVILPIFLLVTIAFAGKILSMYQHIPVERVQFVDIFKNPYEENDNFEMQIGEVRSTEVRIFPEFASDKQVTYVSSNEAVCMVDEKGALYGVSYGDAQITVTTHDGNKTALLNVIVKADKVMGITLPYETLTMKLGETTVLKPTVEFPPALNKAVTYVSSNELIVKVDATGKMTALAPGKATITAIAVDNSMGNFAAKCEVTVIMGTPTLAFDFTKADFITIKSDFHISTQTEINLWDYLVFDPELVTKEDIQLKITVGEKSCTLQDGVLTLLAAGKPVTVKAYVGDLKDPTYQTEVNFILAWQ